MGKKCRGFKQVNLVSDQRGVARFFDPNLVNAWGLSRSPTGPWWVSDNGTGVATLYRGDGTPQPLVVKIPPPAGVEESAPTGNVFNPEANQLTDEFVISQNGKSAPAIFLFANENGTISGWNPAVDPTTAVVAVNRSSSNAIYKGITIASSGKSRFLYATNFQSGLVEVFDTKFKLIRAFTDPEIPCPFPDQCFAPFNISTIEGRLFATFALQDKEHEDDVKGPGNGFVTIFDPEGNVIRRLISQGPLNSPWGLAIAPCKFGPFGGDLLVGNFGDGRINVFDLRCGKFRGTISDRCGRPITIDGLWAIAFGNGADAGSKNDLFFTAGPDDEEHGLFGLITVDKKHK